MKFGVVSKSTTVNRFVLHTLHRNITHLAIITRKPNIKLDILKGWGKVEKSQYFYDIILNNLLGFEHKIGSLSRGGSKCFSIFFCRTFDIF